MSDAMTDRRKAFEEKFRLDQDLQFKVNARRDKLLGLWLGERLGLGGNALTEYASSVVLSDLAKPGDEDVVAKVLGDIKERGLAISEKEVRAKLHELGTTAKHQIMDEHP